MVIKTGKARSVALKHWGEGFQGLKKSHKKPPPLLKHLKKPLQLKKGLQSVHEESPHDLTTLQRGSRA